MTTVAFKDGIMASDSSWSDEDDNGLLSTLQSKITRLSSGALLGSGGLNDNRDMLSLLDKVKTPAGLPSCEALSKIRMGYSGLLVFPKGSRIFKIVTTDIHETQWDGKEGSAAFGAWEISFPFAAIGSGAFGALCAMAAGKGAKDAVAIACRYDMASKLPVHAVPLQAPPKRKPKS